MALLSRNLYKKGVVGWVKVQQSSWPRLMSGGEGAPYIGGAAGVSCRVAGGLASGQKQCTCGIVSIPAL